MDDSDHVKRQIGTREAIEIATKAGIKLTRPTLVSWCEKYGLGHQLGTGKWSVYKYLFIDFLNGKKEKLDGK